jgi:hypothetical protein
MNGRRWNWLLWVGFLSSLAGFASYLPLSRFPVTRDVPWVNFLLFAAGLSLLLVGLKRAFGKPEQYHGKISGPILTTLSFLILGSFCFVVFYQPRQLPASSRAPRVGQRAPEFELIDTNNKAVSLASLLTTPLVNSQMLPKGVLIIFYRGYW